MRTGINLMDRFEVRADSNLVPRLVPAKVQPGLTSLTVEAPPHHLHSTLTELLQADWPKDSALMNLRLGLYSAMQEEVGNLARK